MLNVKAFKKVAVTVTAVSALGLAVLMPAQNTSALASTTNTGVSSTATSGQSTVTLAAKIIATGEKYLGTPYRFGAPSGQTRVFDCSSFTQYVFGKNGIKLPRTSSQQSTVGTYVRKANLQVGDLLFFKTSKSNGKVGHVAIYAGNNKILHTYGPGGVRYDSLSTKWLAQSYLGAKRVIKQTYASTPTNSNTGTTTTKPSTNTESPEVSKALVLADKIIATGNKYLGTPYVFGAQSGQTRTFDCSSFQQYIFGQHGIKLPRTSRSQSTLGTYVAKSDLRKGDLIFFETSKSNGAVAHVAVYAGDGKILHTYGPGGVRYDSLSGWWGKTYLFAKRVIK